MPKSRKESEGDVAEKASTVTPRPVDAEGDGAGSKKRKKKANYDRFDSYLHNLLKVVAPELGTTQETTSMMNDLVKDVFNRVILRAGELRATHKKQTLGKDEIVSASQLCFGGELGKQCVTNIAKAITAYKSYESPS